MGFRFRKSVKIAPGVRLNLNRKSATIVRTSEPLIAIVVSCSVFVFSVKMPEA